MCRDTVKSTSFVLIFPSDRIWLWMEKLGRAV